MSWKRVQVCYSLIWGSICNWVGACLPAQSKNLRAVWPGPACHKAWEPGLPLACWGQWNYTHLPAPGSLWLQKNQKRHFFQVRMNWESRLFAILVQWPSLSGFIPQLWRYVVVRKTGWVFSFFPPLPSFLSKISALSKLDKSIKANKELQTCLHTTSLVSCAILPEQCIPFAHRYLCLDTYFV